jgi:hypothetical protein
MSLIALLTWIATASLGLYLLSIWLIEYDKDFQADAATRLPPPVLVAHVVLGGGGLIVWAYYLFYDSDDLAWISLAAVLLGASLGTFMAVRWLSVYRAKRQSLRAERLTHLWRRSGGMAVLDRPAALRAGPPERNFPLPVVIAHGAFATATITLVLLTALGVGGS